MTTEPLDSRSPTGQQAQRIIGFDVARALAILGMFLVHFSMVAGADQNHPKWMASVLGFLDGRSAATFMILAGIGLTHFHQRSLAQSSGEPAAWRSILVRRGLILIAAGFINLVIWQGDILRVYGVSLCIVPWMIGMKGRSLLAATVAIVFTFTLLVLVGDFDRNWDWDKLNYRNLWTPMGLLRNLFFDGFRSVLPWLGFILYGIWLGRLDLGSAMVRRRALAVAITITAATELLSWTLVSILSTHSPSTDEEEITALFGTESMPALPLFLLAAGGTATVVIVLCVVLTSRWPGLLWRPLALTGQMSLTWYFAHIVVGLGAVVGFGLAGTQPLVIAAAYGVLAFAIAVVLSCVWKKTFRHGPLEWLLRRLAGS